MAPTSTRRYWPRSGRRRRTRCASPTPCRKSPTRCSMPSGACERRGQSRPQTQARAAQREGEEAAGEQRPDEQGKAAFIFERRYLIVKRAENLSEQERADLQVMFGY